MSQAEKNTHFGKKNGINLYENQGLTRSPTSNLVFTKTNRETAVKNVSYEKQLLNMPKCQTRHVTLWSATGESEIKHYLKAFKCSFISISLSTKEHFLRKF